MHCALPFCIVEKFMAQDLQKQFIAFDASLPADADAFVRMQHERSLLSVFQSIPFPILRDARIAYLQASKSSADIIHFLQSYRPNLAIYAGSFNPFHLGHLNIVHKAAAIFEKVIIARGINPEKDTDEAIWNAGALDMFETAEFAGLLTQFIDAHAQYGNVTLVKGLRNGDDLDYEVNQLRFMETMYPQLKVVFIQCDKEYEHISSTALRNLERIQPGLSKPFLP